MAMGIAYYIGFIPRELLAGWSKWNIYYEYVEFLVWDNSGQLLDIVVVSLMVGYFYKSFLNYLIIE